MINMRCGSSSIEAIPPIQSILNAEVKTSIESGFGTKKTAVRY